MSGGPTSKNKSTIYVGGLADDVDEAILLEVFSTFGDIIDIQIPTGTSGPYPSNPSNNPGGGFQAIRDASNTQQQGRHRGFAFLAYASAVDAQDAIDNMDLNELRGKVLKVNLARPMKGITTAAPGNRAIWESEDWLQQHGKKGVQAGYGATAKDPQAGDQDEEQVVGDGEEGGEDQNMEV